MDSQTLFSREGAHCSEQRIQQECGQNFVLFMTTSIRGVTF